jgi:hypothetical protein
MALLDQAPADERRHLVLVFDDQRAHDLIVSVGSADETAMRASATCSHLGLMGDP